MEIEAFFEKSFNRREEIEELLKITIILQENLEVQIVIHLILQLLNFMPIYFHNGANFDYNEHEMKVIPLTNEEYISFSKRVNFLYLRFLDNCKYMHNSLDSLVKTFNNDQFKLLETEYPASRHRINK